jgi:hypothetical protein
MAELRRLRTGFQLNEAFMRGEESLPEGFANDFVRDIGRDVSLVDFDVAVERLISDTQPQGDEIDRRAAPAVHEALDLTRREAADMGIWRYLSIVHCPEFVRHRWEYSSRSEMRRRFVGSNKWNSNTFSRLWWAAELTHSQAHGYELTQKAFTSQHVARSAFERLFSHHPDTAAAFVDVFHEDSQEVVETAVKRFNQRLTTVRVEAIDRDRIEWLLDDIRMDVRQELGRQ